jgi:DEAD/DEAH box helicase domain-containing protein
MLSDFGEKLWELLIYESESLKSIIQGDNVLQKLTYSDCYISSPWALILFSEVIDSLKEMLGNQWSEPNLNLVTGENKINFNIKGLYADWRTNSDKSGVITEYFEQIDEKINVEIKPIRDLPHGRLLTLEWSDGSISYIRFDHGVGCWSMGKQPGKWFNVEDDAESQVQYMFDVFKNIRVRYNKKFPTQIFVKKR